MGEQLQGQSQHGEFSSNVPLHPCCLLPGASRHRSHWPGRCTAASSADNRLPLLFCTLQALIRKYMPIAVVVLVVLLLLWFRKKLF
jgi:hypothetical protein